MLKSARLKATLTDPTSSLDDDHIRARSRVLVNARFGTTPDADVEYYVVKVG